MVSRVLVYNEAGHHGVKQSGAVKPLTSQHLERKTDRARGRDLAQSICFQVKSPVTSFLSLDPGPKVSITSPDRESIADSQGLSC